MSSHHLFRIVRYLSDIVDKGGNVEVEMVVDKVSSGCTIQWLVAEYPTYDFSILTNEYKHAGDEVNKLLKDEYYGTSLNSNRFNNGYCFLITLVSEAIYRSYEENNFE
ncbi:hypothetical protein RQP50_05680 [Paenibacillus sp. chi10]|uniref:Uncharacterized protein n=1 Tax=Paenibacillus suaedae TaxID=3077233 RepID=A0AAJ2JWU4_9BACL|nr:hypothetical protein [Paenibacillus sp. chi10]MDT8975729.1 hypothetical protein [Paenibacillus sp. chi10]